MTTAVAQLSIRPVTEAESASSPDFHSAMDTDNEAAYASASLTPRESFASAPESRSRTVGRRCRTACLACVTYTRPTRLLEPQFESPSLNDVGCGPTCQSYWRPSRLLEPQVEALILSDTSRSSTPSVDSDDPFWNPNLEDAEPTGDGKTGWYGRSTGRAHLLSPTPADKQACHSFNYFHSYRRALKRATGIPQPLFSLGCASNRPGGLAAATKKKRVPAPSRIPRRVF